MEMKFECAMLLAFLAAVLVLLVWHVQFHARWDMGERLGLILAEAGFVAGAMLGYRTGGLLEFILGYFGMLLTLTTLALSWPDTQENAREEV